MSLDIALTITKQIHFSHVENGEPVFEELETITASRITGPGTGYAWSIPLRGGETPEHIEMLKQLAVSTVERGSRRPTVQL